MMTRLTMRLRAARRGAIATAFAAVAACTPTGGVEVESSRTIEGDLRVERDPVIGQTPTPAPAPPGPEESELPVADAPAAELVWGPCEPFDAPPAEVLGTSGWECATLVAPMDPFGDDADAGDINLALTRHRATGERRGTIVLNPGGPGGEGLPTAWAVRGGMPADLLRAFDIVAWDPRGVGQSSPRIDCDDAVSPSDIGFIARCNEVTGPLSAFLSAPYSAADMEAIRLALGESELNYLGYSYGTVLGATYAATYPDTVGAFVLDGATDPLVGSADGPFRDGFPSLADDGRDTAFDRFAELCNATDRCLFSLDAATVVDDLAVQVPAFGTPLFAGSPDSVSSDAYDALIDESLQNAFEWELLATALADADAGDASTLAALISRNSSLRIDSDDDGDGGDDADGYDGDGDESDDGDGGGESDFAEANFMIYCADFAPVLVEWSFCDDMAPNLRPLEPVRAVDVDQPILVIGTTYDPLTPGYHAVSDQFFRVGTIDDELECSFLFGIEDDTELGDILFGHGDIESLRLLERSFDATVSDDEASCLASVLNDASDRVISHVALDVTSDAAGAAADEARREC